MDVRVFPLGPLSTNCFAASNNGEAIIVDPGGNPQPVLDYLAQSGLTLTHILDTHLHCDHIYGNEALRLATGAPILASEADRFLLDTPVGGGGLMGLPMVESFDFQGLRPGKTSGHTPGSLSFFFPAAKVVFVGDLIFQRSIGRTDFPGGDLDALMDSVRAKIFTLPADTVIYPGHGPATSVGQEKAHNPFFSDFA